MGKKRHKGFRVPSIQASKPDRVDNAGKSERAPQTLPTSKLHIGDIQAFLIIAALGLVTYFSGLSNPFMGDDDGQIVNNLTVHSISNLARFFEGGTFYSVGSA